MAPVPTVVAGHGGVGGGVGMLRNATRCLFVLSDFRLTQLMQHALMPFHLASKPDSLSESVACQHLFNHIIRY